MTEHLFEDRSWVSRLLRIPREPVPLALLLLTWEKRHGHLPCGQGAAACPQCARAWERVETDHYPGPPEPVLQAAVDLIMTWYADPAGAVPRFVPAQVP